jgi:hypothetical protein
MRSKLILIAVLAAATGFSACNQNKQEEAGTVQTGQQQPSGKLKDEKLSAAYSGYIELKNALVASNAVNAKMAAGNLQNSLREVQGGETAQQYAGQISKTDDIKTQREHFSALSGSFIELVKKADKGDAKVYVQHCPMALNGKWADWISESQEIRNPYFGDEMLECGEVKEELK